MRELTLGGMTLQDNGNGDVDILPRDGGYERTVRLQRADMDEIIDFLKKSKK